MSSRSILLASALCAIFLGACSNRYADVYSFRKNSFVPPPAPASEVTGVNMDTTILEGTGNLPQDGAIPGIPGGPIPGAVPGTGIPGLDAVPGAIPGATPDAGAIPGAGTIPGL